MHAAANGRSMGSLACHSVDLTRVLGILEFAVLVKPEETDLQRMLKKMRKHF